MKLADLGDRGLVPVWLIAVLARGVSWWSLVLVLAVVVAVLTAGLLAEWQRRTTLVALLKAAGPGTVIQQGRGSGGPAMRIELGREPTGQIVSRGD